MSPMGVLALVSTLALGPLHFIAARSDPGYIVQPGVKLTEMWIHSPRCVPSSLPSIYPEAQEGMDPEKEALLKASAKGPNSCWTCGVDRPLRSKHCQV